MAASLITALVSQKLQTGFRLFRGEDLNKMANNLNALSSFGNAGNLALMGGEGNINVQISSAGINPGSTGNDNVLAVYALPANSFDQANRGINIMACGSMNNAATTKTLKIIAGATTATVGSAIVGGTTIASFSDATANSSGGWQLAGNIFKYGVLGSNTQIALHEASQSNTVLGALLAPSLLTLTESAQILIAITGNAAVAANITFNFLCVNAMN